MSTSNMHELNLSMDKRINRMSHPDYHLVFKILDKLRPPGTEYKKTHLQMEVKMNYNNFRQYLEIFNSLGLISIRKNDKMQEFIRITERGIQIHDHLKNVNGIFNNSGYKTMNGLIDNPL